VGDGARIAAQSGVPRDLPAGGEYAGYPAVEAREWRRVSASLPGLPGLLRRVRRVERAIGIGAAEERGWLWPQPPVVGVSDPCIVTSAPPPYRSRSATSRRH